MHLVAQFRGHHSPRQWPTVSLPVTVLTYSSMMATGQEEGMGDPPAFSTWLFRSLAETQLPYLKVLNLWNGGGRAHHAGVPCGLTDLTGKARSIMVPAPGRSTAGASYPSLNLSLCKFLASRVGPAWLTGNKSNTSLS